MSADHDLATVARGSERIEMEHGNENETIGMGGRDYRGVAGRCNGIGRGDDPGRGGQNKRTKRRRNSRSIANRSPRRLSV